MLKKSNLIYLPEKVKMQKFRDRSNRSRGRPV
jgi:hypothetical protein